MKIGMITCNYFMRIYGYQMPEPFSWGEMCVKYRAEFGKGDFLKLAREIRDLGYDCLEIWEPNFSYMVYKPGDASRLATELKNMGFRELAYCIGGWGADDVEQVGKAYTFAKALGAKIVTGCITQVDAGIILPEADRWGRELGIRFAIENHPKPCFESPEDIAEAVKTYETIGANLDTGIYNQQGYDVLGALDLLKDKIYHVHFKDTIKGTKGGCLPIGDGDAPMAALLRKLRDWQYGGMVSVEFEYENDPAPGLARSIAYMRGVLA